MTFAVLGTGNVGQALASKLVALGHETVMGSRTPDNAAATAWAETNGPRASSATFADAAARASIILLAVSGQHAMAVLEAAGEGLSDKILIDITNPLDFSKGFPPRLTVCNDDSLGEQIQRAHPEVRVVKAFNTLSNTLMVAPERLPEPTEMFIAGDDDEAKARVTALLVEFGHKDPIDMGGIDASRGLEAWLLLWTRLYGVFGTGEFNIKIVRG